MSEASQLAADRETFAKEVAAWHKSEAERKQKQTDADRLLVKTQAEVNALEPRASRLRSVVETLKQDYADLTADISVATHELEGLNDQLGAARGQIDKLTAVIEQSNQEVEKRKLDIDQKLDKYESENRGIIEERLDVLSHTYEIESEKLLDAQTELERVRHETDEVLANHQRIEDKLFAMQEAAQHETTELEDELLRLRARNTELDNQNRALLTKQADLQIENARLESANKEFKAYEAKAWAALDNADAAIQDREQKVQEREQFRPRSQSYLPPRAD